MDSITGSTYPDRLDLAGDKGWVQCVVGTKEQFQFWFASTFWNEISVPNRESIQSEMVSYKTGLWLAPWTEELDRRSDRSDDSLFEDVTNVFAQEIKCDINAKGWNNGQT